METNLDNLPDALESCHTANCCAIVKLATDKVVLFEGADPNRATVGMSQQGLQSLGSMLVAAHA